MQDCHLERSGWGWSGAWTCGPSLQDRAPGLASAFEDRPSLWNSAAADKIVSHPSSVITILLSHSLTPPPTALLFSCSPCLIFENNVLKNGQESSLRYEGMFAISEEEVANKYHRNMGSELVGGSSATAGLFTIIARLWVKVSKWSAQAPFPGWGRYRESLARRLVLDSKWWKKGLDIYLSHFHDSESLRLVFIPGTPCICHLLKSVSWSWPHEKRKSREFAPSTVLPY